MSIIPLQKILDSRANFEDRFIPTHKNLSDVVMALKNGGYKIVLTQGVYDLIHEGHALYLEKAKALGDILIVGVDSDELTRKRKGPDRPIVPQSERLKMLVQLRHVDLVTVREIDHDIGDLIKLVKPDVLVLSESTKDFTRNEAENDYKKFCGEIVCLPPQATTSTTARIRNLTIEGANKFATEVKKLTEDFIANIRNN